MTLDPTRAAAHVDQAWDGPILEVLKDYIRIPNVSMDYNPAWADDGHMDAAVELIRQWCQQQVDDELSDATVELQELEGRSPLLIIDVPASGGASDDDTIVLYGHLDKQPPFKGWRAGLGPWEPVIQDDRLYGRGSADDGYAVFSALSAIAATRAAGGQHSRCLVLIEASEESGSPDLPAHLEALGSRLGAPSLVVALDSSCGDWDRLWVTTSLRGMVELQLRVDILCEGVHSGEAGGIVPSSFRILRNLLERIEDSTTGRLTLAELHAEVPELRRQQAEQTAEVRGNVAAEYPFVAGASPMEGSTAELLLDRSWGPTLEVVGLEGAPPPASAGNVLRPYTVAKLSFRLPPTTNAQLAADVINEALTSEPLYDAQVTAIPGTAEDGWHAPPEPDWLLEALDDASTAAFGQPALTLGEGGSIPFMGMLGRMFPNAHFVVTGVLGPESNAHGPNEFLHLPTARRVTAALAHLLDAHTRR